MNGNRNQSATGEIFVARATFRPTPQHPTAQRLAAGVSMCLQKESNLQPSGNERHPQPVEQGLSWESTPGNPAAEYRRPGETPRRNRNRTAIVAPGEIVLIQCPDCQTKMRPKPKEGTKPGVKVIVKCRCGTTLRFTMPGTPRDKEAERRADDLFDSLWKDIL